MSLWKKILLPLLVLVAGAGLAFVIARSKPEVERQLPETPPPLVTVIEAQRRDVPLDVASQGTVEPRTESTLVAQVSGRIVEVSPDFAEGSFVREGQLLLRIDPRDYELAVRQAESAVATAEVRLETEKAQAELARQEWEELGRADEPSPLALRQPQLREARAVLESARAGLAQARLQLERTGVRAPFTGRVRAKRADLGASVSPGTPLATVFATDWAEVRLPVPKEQLAFLELGPDLDSGGGDLNRAGIPVQLSAEIGGGLRRWRARVVRTGGVIDPRTRMLDLFARVDDPYGQKIARRELGAGWSPLPMGLFVEAEISGRVAEEAVVAPRTALSPEGLLMMVDAEDRLEFRPVEILRTEADRVVIGKGVAEGERIVVSPLETPVEGMRLRVTPEVAAPGEETSS